MGQTRVLLHSHLGWRHLAEGTYLLGRSKDCDIVIPSNRVSRRHAQITVTGSGAWVEDLGSSNGTHVNGEPVQGRQQLRHQDFVGIGANALEVALEPDQGSSQAGLLRPRSTTPPPQDATSETTLGASNDDGPDQAVEAWAEGVLASARAARLDDSRTRRSAMQFGIQRASSRPSARWVDFVVELASLGIPLDADHARVLSTAIDRVGVDATLVDTFLARIRVVPPSPEQQELRAVVENWRDKTRDG